MLGSTPMTGATIFGVVKSIKLRLCKHTSRPELLSGPTESINHSEHTELSGLALVVQVLVDNECLAVAKVADSLWCVQRAQPCNSSR
jgi:hypothetical protein